MRERLLALGIGLGMLAAAWGQDQAALLDQANREMERSDARLRDVYSQIMAELDEAQRKKLAGVQASWDAFRQESSQVTAELVSRSEAHRDLLAVYERIVLTRKRTRTLERILEAQSKQDP